MKRAAANTNAKLVDTEQFARDRARCTGRVAVADMARLAPLLASTAGEFEYEFDGELDAHGRQGATLRARGHLTQRCDLCELEVTQSLDVRAKYYFVADATALDELPLEGDDERELLVASRRFDVGQLVEDEAILALPISPRHSACDSALAAKPKGDAADSDGAATDGTERPSPFAALAALKGRGAR